MGFAVSLLTDSAQVEPGTSVPVTVEVINHGEVDDHFEISIEGLDPEWTAVPVPTFTLEPGRGRSERFFLKPPRDSDSTAGSYPFVVRVRSLDSGEAKTMQGVLQIKSFTHLALDVAPRKTQVTPIRREALLTVSCSNLGNTEQTLQLFATDTEDAFAYEFETNQASLAPGSTREVTLKATAAKRSLFASTRLHQVTITGRNVNNPAIAASAAAQIEQRAVMTPMSFFVAVVLAVIAFAWVLLLPKPPSVVFLRLSSDRATVNDIVSIRWRAANATGVKLTIGSVSYDKDPTDEVTYTPTEPGPVQITIHAISGEHVSPDVTKVLQVDQRKTPAPPEIVQFDIKPSNLRKGDTFLVTYKLGPSVTEARLMPSNIPLDLAADQIQLNATMVGTVVYKLIARNSDNVVVDKSVTVNVVEQSAASIDKFDVTPVLVDPLVGRVTVDWGCTNAAKVQLLVGDQSIDLDPVGGKQDVTVLKDTTITIVATDVAGLATQKKIDVKMKPNDGSPLTGGDTGRTPPPTTAGGG